MLTLPGSLMAQHEHHETVPARPVPPVGSGTAWLPQAAPVRGFHLSSAGWRAMLHGSVFLQYIREFGPRGNWQLGSVNWLMGDAARPVAGGILRLRAMASAEFLTLTAAGYPQLLQVAQPYKGQTLADRMHPHELVSEAALAYERPIAGGLWGSLYFAAVGEPALGPVMYMHRPSAENDPMAPLSHHAQDVTHESFGVATVGLFSRVVRLEASVFNGAHPDEVRTNFEYDGARLNAVSVRLTTNPSPRWSIAASRAYLPETGGEHAHGALHRYVLSILYAAPRHGGGAWNTAFIWGANVPQITGRLLSSALVETSLDLNPRTALFGRVEYVRRTDEELGLVGSVSPELDIASFSLGLARWLGEWHRVALRVGVRGKLDFVPEELKTFYDSRTPQAVLVYLQLHPPLMMQH